MASFSHDSKAEKIISKLANSNAVYTQLRNIGFSSTAYQVESISIPRDAAVFNLKKGVMYFLLPVEGQVTGAVFIGEGEMKLQPFLPCEQRLIKYLTAESYLSETFSTIVFRFTDKTYQEIEKSAKPAQDIRYDEAARLWKDFRKLFRKGRNYVNNYSFVSSYIKWNMDIRILQDIKSRLSDGIFLAFFKGEKYGEFLYINDPMGVPLIEPEEVALLGLSDGNLGYWYAAHFKDHYRNREVVDPSPINPIDIINYNIDVSLKGSYMDAIARMNFTVVADSVQVLPLILSPKLRVKQVKDAMEHEFEFIQEDENEDADFAVIFPKPMKKGETAELIFRYEGKNSVKDEGSGNYTLIDRDNWYPNLGFGRDGANFEMTFRLEKDLTLVATGHKVDETIEKDIKISKWKSDIPLFVAGFNYGKFDKKEIIESKTGYQIETYANDKLPNSLYEIQDFTPGSIDTRKFMDKARAEAQASIYIYSQTFGKHPYGRIAISQQPFIDFGQGWPMLVFLPITSFFSEFHRNWLQLDRGSYTNTFYKAVNAHEIAHQWWGQLIGSSNYRDTWLVEGFAEFSSSLFINVVYGHDTFLDFWKELRQQLTEKSSIGKQAILIGSVDMGYRSDTSKTGYPSYSIVYAKGAYILHMLRMLMWSPEEGDKLFFTMLQDYASTYANKNATTVDFIKMVEKYMPPQLDLAGNKRMDWFMDEWIYGTYLPEYKLDYSYEKGQEGNPVLIAKVTQGNVDSNFIMLVPLYAEFDNKQIIRLGTVRIKGNSTSEEIKIQLPKKPKKVMLCANEDVLAKIK